MFGSMKNIIVIIVLFSGAFFFSCKGKKTEENQSNSAQSAADNTDASTSKVYTVVATPDSAVLGKNHEAIIKIKDIKAIPLSDPDGKNTGTQLSYSIEVTNKNQIGGSSVYINPNDFRLELDNGTKLTHDNYNTVSTDADATGTSVDNKFKLPPGTKPTALDLFYDETKATVTLEMK